jgi:hypothetical protein
MEFEQIHNKYNTEYTSKLLASKHIFYEIYEACGNKFWNGCGSYLFDGKTYSYCASMYEKQELLYQLVKSATNILEIGTYMGHSLLIMLLSNPTLKITCVDIDDTYTRPAVSVLNKYFPNAITFLHSDSLTALEALRDPFDFFHIDGDHQNDVIAKEFECIQKLNSRPDRILRIVFDDEDCCQELQGKILLCYRVLQRVRPHCSWSNAYFEIQL